MPNWNKPYNPLDSQIYERSKETQFKQSIKEQSPEERLAREREEKSSTIRMAIMASVAIAVFILIFWIIVY